MIEEFWSSATIYKNEIVGKVFGLHISVSRASISQLATGCPNESLIYEEVWDTSLPYSLKNFVDVFL